MMRIKKKKKQEGGGVIIITNHLPTKNCQRDEEPRFTMLVLGIRLNQSSSLSGMVPMLTVQDTDGDTPLLAVLKEAVRSKNFLLYNTDKRC